MKLLVIAASLNEKSGWGRYSRAVINELISQGHEVRVLSENTPVGTGFPVYAMRSLDTKIPILPLIANMFLARRLAKSVDVVHALDGWPYGVYGLAAVLGTDKRLLINGVGTYAVAPLYAWGSSMLLRAAYARAVAIPCISNYTRDQIRAAGVGPDKVITVHMGAPVLPTISPSEVQTRTRAAGIPERARPVILTIGAIKERKGQFDTLRAITILKHKFPNILYVAAGSGSHKDYITTMKDYAAEHGLLDNLRILTDVDDRTLAALYASCTVFALNSNSDSDSHHFEGFGLVVLEAAGYGKPAVGSRHSGVEDTIKEGESGLLIRQHDEKDIAEKIETILHDYDRYAANTKKWHAQFTWQKTVQGYIRHYT